MISTARDYLAFTVTQDRKFSPPTEIGFQKCIIVHQWPWFHEHSKEKTGGRCLFQPLLPSPFGFFLRLPCVEWKRLHSCALKQSLPRQSIKISTTKGTEAWG